MPTYRTCSHCVQCLRLTFGRTNDIPDDPAFSQSDYNSDCGSEIPLFEQSSESDDCNTGYSHSSHNPISRWTLQFCLNWLPLCNSVPLTCKHNSNPRTSQNENYLNLKSHCRGTLLCETCGSWLKPHFAYIQNICCECLSLDAITSGSA